MTAAARERSGRTQWACRRRVEGAPKASPSVPVHALTGQGARGYAQTIIYSSEELRKLHQPSLPLNPDVGTFLSFTKILQARKSFPEMSEFIHIPWASSTAQLKHTALRIFYLNTRSLVEHQLDVFLLLTSEKPDIFLITETWLTPYSTPDILPAVPPDYYILQVNRPPGKMGGGVAAIIHRDHKFTAMTSLSLPAVDNLVIKLESSSAPLICVLVYRPPQHMPLFPLLLSEQIANLAMNYAKILVIGDLNYWSNDTQGGPILPN